MGTREKLLLREVEKELDPPTGYELAVLESDNDVKSKPDVQLQKLIDNYRKAAEALSRYLEQSGEEKKTEYEKLDDVNSSDSENFSISITDALKKKFEEKRLKDLKRIEDRERAEQQASKEQPGKLVSFVKGIFKD